MAAGGRDGRRRRMLNDGSRAATSAADASDGPEARDPQLPKVRRFAPNAASPSFAVARGALPTQGGPLAAAIGAGLLLTGGVLAADRFQSRLPEALGDVLSLGSAHSLAGWLAASLMLAAAGMCGIIFGIRSNRTDDVRGLYRWWFAAAAALLLTSAAYATGLGGIAARELSQLTGFAPLAGAGWWIAGLVVGGGVLAIRPALDLLESRLSTVLTILAGLCLATSWAGAGGFTPSGVATHAQLAQTGGLLGALVFGIGAQLAYLRRVLLETDGVLAAPVKKPKPARPAKTSGDEPAEQPARPAVRLAPAPKPEHDEPPAQPAEQPQPKSAREEGRGRREAAASQTEWTDGTDGADDHDDDSPRRKLSKAERKKLRKAKASGRYAA